ncbi:MAG: GNAT family N-acetyltransferase [Planctomycetia bacterium]|nr:GNAT family N-acetyltransferase [Planctomycetia bacterium]
MALVVASAGAKDRTAACRALFASGLHAELAARRFAGLFESGVLDPDGLIVATDAGAIRGAMLSYRIGGAQAAVWPPAADDSAIQDALVAGALAWIGREPTKVIQSLVRSVERPRAAALERAGFRAITSLAFLSRECRGADANHRPERLHLRPMAAYDDAFVTMLLRTYDGTLDVPELNGTRTPEEILAGYHANGPSVRWWLEWEGETVGLLLLGVPSDDPTVELSYVGLVPEARSRGLGREAIDIALAEAARLARQAVQLNVDVRNEPALRIYRDRFFRTDDLRELYLRVSE